MGEQRGDRGRSGPVPLAVVSVAIVCWILYQHASPAVADVVIWPYAACLVLGAAVVYPAVRLGGAGAARAVCVSLVIPLLWLAKEFTRVSAVFSPAETAYYALNPLSVGIFCAAGVEMALAELAIGPRGGRGLLGWPGGVLAAFALLALGAFWVGHDSGGREIFYGYIAIYRKLFPG